MDSEREPYSRRIAGAGSAPRHSVWNPAGAPKLGLVLAGLLMGAGCVHTGTGDAERPSAPTQRAQTAAPKQAVPPKDPFSHIPDDVFIEQFKTNAAAVMCRVPQSVTYRYHDVIAELDQGFKLYVDVYYREKQPARRRPALIFMHDWARGKQPMLAGDRQCG